MGERRLLPHPFHANICMAPGRGECPLWPSIQCRPSLRAHDEREQSRAPQAGRGHGSDVRGRLVSNRQVCERSPFLTPPWRLKITKRSKAFKSDLGGRAGVIFCAHCGCCPLFECAGGEGGGGELSCESNQPMNECVWSPSRSTSARPAAAAAPLTEEKRAQIEESRVPALLRHASRSERSAQGASSPHALPVQSHTGICDHRRAVARPSPLRSRLSRFAALPRDERAAASLRRGSGDLHAWSQKCLCATAGPAVRGKEPSSAAPVVGSGL